ncbi:ABC transporter permease [Clostridia bacterium]|nr:ABC transporter permease [Clostridia bacterium]
MLLNISLKYIKKHLRQYLLTVTVAALSISLTIAVMLVSSSIKDSVVYTTMPFDMIVGAKGSAAQLVLNTVFLQDTPVGNVDGDLYERFTLDERAQRIVPLAFGDSYKGFRIVGTSADILEMRPTVRDEPVFQLDEGRFFERSFEIVLGATAARELGLKLGDHVSASHGLTALIDDDGHNHDQAYTVVGILNEMRRPYDRGIFTSVETFWEIHGGDRDVSAFIVTPKDYVGLMTMYQELNGGALAQGVFPGQVVGELFGIIGQSEDVLRMVSYAVAALGFAAVIISLYWSVLNRQKENAIFRALGAGRRNLLTMVIAESLLVMVASGALGLILGHAVAVVIGGYLRDRMAVYAAAPFEALELGVVGVYIFIGVVGAMLPAWNAYKQEVTSQL